MSADVTPIRPPEPPSRDRSLESIFDGMQDGLNALLCIHAALDDPRIDECEGFSAARSLLHRTFRDLTTTLEVLEAWAGRAERAGELERVRQFAQRAEAESSSTTRGGYRER